MSKEHDCSQNACKGTKLDGACVVCQRYLKPVFLECIYNRKEVNELINAIYGTTNNQYNSPQVIMPSKIVTKVKMIFACDSVFSFTCIECKEMGTYTDIMNTLKEQVNQLKLSLTEQDDKMNKISDDYIRANEMAQEYLIQNSNLKTEIVNIKKMVNDEQSLKNNEILDDNNMDTLDNERNVDLNQKVERLFNNLLTQLNSQIRTMSQEIESGIKLEFDKIKSDIKNTQNSESQYGNSAKREKDFEQ